MHNMTTLELLQTICIACGTALINECLGDRNITGDNGRCCA
jgi:hypothetical protein